MHQNHIIKVRFSGSILSLWALRWLLSPSGRGAIETVASSTSGLHTLSISKIENLPVPVPPLEEASIALSIVEEALTAGSDAVDECKKLMRDWSALRQSILKAAFEGRLVPQDPREEPASALLARLRGSNSPRPPRRRRPRATGDSSHPSLPGLSRQSMGPAGRGGG